MTTSADGEAPNRSLRRVFGDRAGRLATPTRPLRQRLRLPLMVAGPAVVILGGLWWYVTSGRYVSTDDAYIQSARTVISADVSGRVLTRRGSRQPAGHQGAGALPPRPALV